MDLELEGRIGVVTGASVGIGRGIAKVLAKEGMQLLLVARRDALLDEVAAELETSFGRRPATLVQDVTQDDAPQRIRDAAMSAFGRIDVLVNNAGRSWKLPVDAADEEWDRAFELNFRSVRRITHELLPAMRAQRWGRIINITGSSEPKGLNAANAAKAAVHAWSKALSREVGRDGITINSIPPGRINSEQIIGNVHSDAEEALRFAATEIPLGYFGEPEDLACLAAFLASPKARYITGEIVHVDGGLRRFAQ